MDLIKKKNKGLKVERKHKARLSPFGRKKQEIKGWRGRRRHKAKMLQLNVKIMKING